MRGRHHGGNDPTRCQPGYPGTLRRWEVTAGHFCTTTRPASLPAMSSPHDTFNLRPLADVAVRVAGPADPSGSGSDPIAETFYLNRFPLLSRSGYFREVLLAAGGSAAAGGGAAGGTPVIETVSSESGCRGGWVGGGLARWPEGRGCKGRRVCVSLELGRPLCVLLGVHRPRLGPERLPFLAIAQT
jgi:hypothetical protein